MEGANQCLSVLLLLYGLDRQAAEVVERLADCRDAARIATYTSVLAACGLIGPDEVAKKLKSMQFGGNVYFEAMCILCTLNEVWDLGDERFDQETLEKLLENPNEETVRQTKTILARILRRYGKAEKAASLAYASVMDTYDRTEWRALDEYCRSARAAGIALDLSVIPAGLKARTNGVDDYLFDVIYYRKGAMHLIDGDRKTATAMMRRIVGDVLTGMNADPRLLARASVAALYLHLEGVRYSNKNLISYSVKWMCSAYKAGLASDEEFDGYLRRLIPLVGEDEDADSIARMLKKNGFGGYELPADTIEDADIGDFLDMDFQYSYRSRARDTDWMDARSEVTPLYKDAFGPAMKSVIVLLGPPGSGKGTQGEMLSEKLGYTRLSTGDMLREAVRNGTELGMKAKGYMDSGALVPNDLIIGLMKEKIASATGGVILDGFPRTVEQADALGQQVDVDLALNLDVPDEELVKRLTMRRSCPDCNAVYHLTNNPPKTEGVCDKCGGKLYQRDDDKDETVKNRLKVYRENTMPLIDYYGQKDVLVTIQGVGSIDDIFGQVQKAVQ